MCVCVCMHAHMRMLTCDLPPFPPSQVGLIAARRTGRLRGGKSVAKDDD